MVRPVWWEARSFWGKLIVGVLPDQPSARNEALSTAHARLYDNSAERWRRSGLGRGGKKGRVGPSDTHLSKGCSFPSQPLSSLIFLYPCTKPNKTRDIVTKKSLGCRLWISSIALFWCIHSTCFWGIAWPQIGCQIRGDSQGARMQATVAQYYVKFQNPNVKNHESQAQRRGQYDK